jgi:hypothetical protein
MSVHNAQGLAAGVAATAEDKSWLAVWPDLTGMQLVTNHDHSKERKMTWPEPDLTIHILEHRGPGLISFLTEPWITSYTTCQSHILPNRVWERSKNWFQTLFFAWPGIHLDCTWTHLDFPGTPGTWIAPDLDFTWSAWMLPGVYLESTRTHGGV